MGCQVAKLDPRASVIPGNRQAMKRQVMLEDQWLVQRAVRSEDYRATARRARWACS